MSNEISGTITHAMGLLSSTSPILYVMTVKTGTQGAKPIPIFAQMPVSVEVINKFLVADGVRNLLMALWGDLKTFLTIQTNRIYFNKPRLNRYLFE